MPLRPVIALIIASTIGAFNSFAFMFGSEVRLPNPIAPGLGYYMRGYHNREIAELKDVMDRSLWDADKAESTPMNKSA